MSIHITHHTYNIAPTKKTIWKHFLLKKFSSAAPILVMVLQLPTDVIVLTTNECVTVSLQDSYFGSDKRTSRKMWQKTPYGLSLPYVQNSMSRDAYEFLRRNLHFADTYKQQP